MEFAPRFYKLIAFQTILLSLPVVSVEAPAELDKFQKSALWLPNWNMSSATVFTPLRAYEDFAATVGDRLGEETNVSVLECVPRTGLHYFLTFTVEYEGKDVG